MLNSVKLAVLASALVAGAAGAVVTVTVEAPGVENTTQIITGGVANFDSVPVGTTAAYSTGFGLSGITGTFNTVLVRNADVYGGAGGTGRYAAVLTGASTTVTFTGAPVTYVGFYGSAIDSGSTVQLFNGSTLVYSGSMPLVPVAAGNFGNPDAPFTRPERCAGLCLLQPQLVDAVHLDRVFRGGRRGIRVRQPDRGHHRERRRRSRARELGADDRRFPDGGLLDAPPDQRAPRLRSSAAIDRGRPRKWPPPFIAGATG